LAAGASDPGPVREDQALRAEISQQELAVMAASGPDDDSARCALAQLQSELLRQLAVVQARFPSRSAQPQMQSRLMHKKGVWSK
jgi:hypothetical protein